MNLQEFARVLRSRWITVCVTTLVVVLISVAITLLTTRLYQATTRLYVSTAGGTSVAEMYQGNRLSQERVLSYLQLLKGETLAQRTIDKLQLDMTPKQLQESVTVSAKPDTVLLNVGVVDKSPVRARDIANALSDEFVVLVRELETPEGSSRPDARVVVEQRASVPTTPASPSRQRNLLAGLGLGLLLGIGLAVVRDLLDNTVKDRSKLEEITNVGLVGAIPMDKNRRKEPAIAFGGDQSSIAEAFRKLRTNLQFLAVDNPPRVIVVTSSTPSEGKSTTAINIALVLAEAENNVLLVDGDMRRPTLARYLGLVESVGFSTVLSGAASTEDVLQKTRYNGLTVLTSGAIPPNPSELLGSMTAKKLLEELRSQFDYIIIDSSPVLAVTDAAILATHSDGVLVLARFGQTNREQLRHAIGSLADVGAKLLGAIFTMTPESEDSRYSYQYYSADRQESGKHSA